jgi:hypothetical protein
VVVVVVVVGAANSRRRKPKTGCGNNLQRHRPIRRPLNMLIHLILRSQGKEKNTDHVATSALHLRAAAGASGIPSYSLPPCRRNSACRCRCRRDKKKNCIILYIFRRGNVGPDPRDGR